MFGEEYGDVLVHIKCPRCNAPAVVRANEQSNIVVKHITCNKCHLVKMDGIATTELIKDFRSLNRVKRMRERSKSYVDQERLDRKIESLKERIELHELGL